MDIRGSFSRLKEKLKHPGSKRKQDRTGADGADVGGVGVDPAGRLSPQLAVSPVVADLDSGDSSAKMECGSVTDSQKPSPGHNQPELGPVVQLPEGGFEHPFHGSGHHLEKNHGKEHPRTVSSDPPSKFL